MKKRKMVDEGNKRTSQTKDGKRRAVQSSFFHGQDSGVMEKQLGPPALGPLIKLSDWRLREAATRRKEGGSEGRRVMA